MKKKILTFIIIMGILVLPLKVMALKYNGIDYATLNLDETLTQESIEHDFSKYKESDSQATIVLFRGKGCHFCLDFLNHLNELVKEGKGKYFKVITFETWYDQNNNELFDEVAAFFGKEADGVPFYIIGDKVFSDGYTSQLDEDIENAIMEEYNKKNKYNLFEEMAKNEKYVAPVQEESNNSSGVIWTFVIVLVSTFTIIGVNYFMYTKLNEKLEKIEDKIKR